MPPAVPSDPDIERQVVDEIGVKLAAILKDYTPSRIHGLLTARGRNAEWETALEHISLHFRPLRDKPKHSVFAKRLRDPENLKGYIKQAVRGPSTLRLSKLKDANAKRTGFPCLVIVREFREAIGEQPDQTFLVIIGDFQGKLVSVYPATKEEADNA